MTAVAAHELRAACVGVTRRALGRAMAAGRQHEERVVRARRPHRGAWQRHRIGDRGRPRTRLMAQPAVARERRASVAAVVRGVNRRVVVAIAMTRVAIGRHVTRHPIRCPLVARAARGGRVPPGERHARHAVALERVRVAPRDRVVALGAGAFVAALVRISMTAFARRRGLHRAGVAAAAGRLHVRAAQRKPGAVVVEAARARGRGEAPATTRMACGAVEILDEAAVRLRGRRAHRERRRRCARAARRRKRCRRRGCRRRGTRRAVGSRRCRCTERSARSRHSGRTGNRTRTRNRSSARTSNGTRSRTDSRTRNRTSNRTRTRAGSRTQPGSRSRSRSRP